jgi:hypothetical protein
MPTNYSYSLYWYEKGKENCQLVFSRRKNIPEVGSVIPLVAKGKKLKVKIVEVNERVLFEYLGGGLIEVIVEIQSGT